jgi:pyridoxamine 5'-phosphate oxidase
MARPVAARTQTDWTVYTLRADEVEFWQADPDRRHLRLRYDRSSDGRWTKGLL